MLGVLRPPVLFLDFFWGGGAPHHHHQWSIGGTECTQSLTHTHWKSKAWWKPQLSPFRSFRSPRFPPFALAFQHASALSSSFYGAPPTLKLHPEACSKLPLHLLIHRPPCVAFLLLRWRQIQYALNLAFFSQSAAVQSPALSLHRPSAGRCCLPQEVPEQTPE